MEIPRSCYSGKRDIRKFRGHRGIPENMIFGKIWAFEKFGGIRKFRTFMMFGKTGHSFNMDLNMVFKVDLNRVFKMNFRMDLIRTLI